MDVSIENTQNIKNLEENKEIGNIEDIEGDFTDSECDVCSEDDEKHTNETDNNFTKSKKKKKEKKHYFEHYIRQILKNILPSKNITKDAKSQLNQLCIIASKIVSLKIKNIVKDINKKTSSEIDAETAVKLTFSGNLRDKCVNMGETALNNYKSYVKKEYIKKISRNDKAHILISPSLLQQITRNNDLNVNSNIHVFLAGVIEAFITDILIKADLYGQKKGVRITINDIELGMKNDEDLSLFLNKNNIYFLNSNVNSFIHPETIKRDGEKDKKTLKNISKIQETNDHVMPKLFFDQKIKNQMFLKHPDIRFKKDCFYNLQEYVEKWTIDLLKYSNILTIYSKKSRVMASDIDMAFSVLNKKIPEYISNK
jgi:histone H3/H4